MSVILRNCCPPLMEVAKLGGLCSQVYAVLWESAYKDVRKDDRLFRSNGSRKQWNELRHCGGTTNWSTKGIAAELGSCRKRVGNAIDQLQDAGFLIAEGFVQEGRGTKTTIWRVVHPDQLEDRRTAIKQLPLSPSETRQRVLTRKRIAVEPDLEFEQFLVDDYIENFGKHPGIFNSDDDYEGDTNLIWE